MRKTLFSLWIMLILTGCTLSKAGPLPTPLPGTALTPAPAGETPASASGVLPTLPAVSTSVIPSAPTPFAAFEAVTAVDGLKLRAGPGYLFDILTLIAEGETLTVDGKSPGGEWMSVTMADGTAGWVFAQMLSSETDLNEAPNIQPAGAIVVTGKITDATGLPIPGIQFAITQGSIDDPNRADVQTNENGEFFAFFPEDASGEWDVSYVAVACDSPVWSDNTCTYYKPSYTGVVQPANITISLPQNVNLSFTWK